MNKTQKTYLFRTIKKNIVSFFAVALMVATGVSIYLGDQSSALAILKRADQYFADKRLQSLEVTSVYGITEKDIEAIAELDEVDAAEGGYSASVLLQMDDGTGNLLIQAHAMLETMNLPVIIEGVLPVSESEAAIEENMAAKEGIQVGDVISVKHDGELKTDSFTVTAIINEPAFCSARTKDARGTSEKGIGSAYYYISVPKTAFDPAYYDGCFTTAYIRNDALDEQFYFSEEYKEQEAALKERIVSFGKERSEIRFQEVQLKAQEKLAEAKTKLEKYDKNLSDKLYSA